MTSGNFHAIPLDKISVNRTDRQRRELNKIDVLADSIRRLGLIHPIVVTRDNFIVAGERRFLACKALGWDMIACQYQDEIDTATLKAIELEENVKRADLTWQEQAIAVHEYHRYRTESEPEWSHDKTAEALGMARSYVSEFLAIVKEAETDERIFAQPKVSTALGITQRNEARRDEETLQEIRKLNAIPIVEKKIAIVQADFNEWAKTYVGPKFNFLHCDFPYGIDANKMQQGGSVATHGGYDDSEKVYWELLASLCNNLDRITTESCHIMFWFSMHYYAETLDFFNNLSDFDIDPFPLIWLKSDNIGLLPDPQRGPRRIYETALFGSRGDRKIVGAVSNAYAAETDRTQHMSTKPEPVLRHFFRMFIDENSLVLDPTAGSGSALRAAESLGAAHILGVERNGDFIERANLAIEAARRLRGEQAK